MPRKKKQPAQAAPQQTYGQAGAQIEAQRAIPLPAGGPLPEPITPFGAPTQRPDEHVMTGAPAGPGPGPEILPQPGGDLIPWLAALYREDPTEEIRGMLEEAQYRAGQPL